VNGVSPHADAPSPRLCVPDDGRRTCRRQHGVGVGMDSYSARLRPNVGWNSDRFFACRTAAALEPPGYGRRFPAVAVYPIGHKFNELSEKVARMRVFYSSERPLDLNKVGIETVR